MSEAITVVTGFQRCGSSLTMRMLIAGGMPAYFDHVDSYETDAMLRLPADHAWLADCAGKAVKILEPHRFTPPRGLAYRFILLSRDRVEQAKSSAKFLGLLAGIRLTREEQRALSLSYVRDLPIVRKMLRSYDDSTVYELRFEDLVGPNRQHFQASLAEFVGLPPHVTTAMNACVIDRPTTCLPYLLEAEIGTP